MPYIQGQKFDTKFKITKCKISIFLNDFIDDNPNFFSKRQREISDAMADKPDLDIVAERM